MPFYAYSDASALYCAQKPTILQSTDGQSELTYKVYSIRKRVEAENTRSFSEVSSNLAKNDYCCAHLPMFWQLMPQSSVFGYVT